MMGGSGTGFGVAGGPAPHIPVLAGGVINYLAPREGGLYVDATFGAGGHSRLILASANCRVIGIDRDPSAIAGGASLAKQAAGRLVLAQSRFSALEDVLAAAGADAIDGLVADLGVSSMQLDIGARGFSFRADGPLDMRMGSSEVTAADVVAYAGERDLAAIIATLGEERHARAVARAIVAERSRSPIRTTAALADIVGRVVRSRPGEIHPATRTFQALRIFVNDELQEVVDGLTAAERCLRPGGRLVMIAFHSLEDRIVKSFLSLRARAASVSRHQPERAHIAPTWHVLTPRPLPPDADEIAANPRARSAKLRAAERTAAVVTPMPFAPVPRLPTLAAIMKGR
jgi:16S rRNA (cytosine1402-N4)-methyltransferase